ncbi:Protein of unknown function UPF0058 [Methanolacinia petrolearia DSM 11571]|uniref:Metal-binding protein n=1 Tax=Methanolacinia petrolearia (strain DSM 11571 / OCM 486 / SEBR 4847) TaxID=679926 RepID=E1REA6_METP4|nr:UPF0058 family protein [Methanolacinia petrolearia]ADN36069.1 Protein of unknown function UPF0058 [Methanolacinia petrolearia DSM 11571]
MHKEELIALHQFMFTIKENLESENPNLSFEHYNSLKINPNQVHKSKMEHKHAIFVLGEEIAEAMKDVEPSASKRIAARMSELARRTEKEIDEMPDEKY